MKAFAYLVFPNSALSTLPKTASGQRTQDGLITSVTHGIMSGKVTAKV